MNLTKMVVKAILENPHGFEWSLQGFGMLRLYLEPETRLHIWDERFQVQNVSQLHDHPWNFDSYVVAGRVKQHRFESAENKVYLSKDGVKVNMQMIQCGEGGGLVGEPKQIDLIRQPLEIFEEGERYRQEANEIHQSLPEDGTVTIIHREFLEDTEHARVFWDLDKSWVTAEPRKADKWEVAEITQLSLAKWFS